MKSQTHAADEAGLRAAAAALTDGGVVLVPTDTTYGLAALASDPTAVALLFVLKRRPAERSIAILVADISQAASLADLNPAERAVAQAFWPGALTVVVSRSDDVDAGLGRDDGTIALRQPADRFVAALASTVGPLATTSANLSGEPPAPNPHAAAASLDGSVAVIIDDGERISTASTVARIGTDGGVTIFREGAIGADQLLAAIQADAESKKFTNNLL